MKSPAIPLFVTLVLAAGHSALADDVDCMGRIGAETIDGNVLVATSCSLEGTTVDGNVELFAGGSLNARNADIDGNVEGDNAFEVDIRNS